MVNEQLYSIESCLTDLGFTNKILTFKVNI